MNCQVTSTVQCVSRRRRVIVTAVANMAEPNNARAAGSEKAAPVGFKAITTPTQPTPIAVQRNHPTCSPRKMPDSAVIMIGAAR